MGQVAYWVGVMAIVLIGWQVLLALFYIGRALFWTAHYHAHVIRRAYKGGRIKDIKWKVLPASLWNTFCSIIGGWTVCSGPYKLSIDGCEFEEWKDSE